MKRKLEHYAELSALSNTFEQDCSHKGAWADYFKNNHPIVCELGCGRGEYTTAMALESDAFNYIGVDIKGARLWRGAKTAFEQALTHVAFLRVQIEQLSNYFEKGEVAEIWVTFPDPQPSQRRSKKRLTSPRFLNLYKHLMPASGILHLKTDSLSLFDYSTHEILSAGGALLTSCKDIYGDTGNLTHDPAFLLSTSVKTSYEQKYLREGRQIHYLAARLS